MDFAFSEDQLAIKESVAKLCAQFPGEFPVYEWLYHAHCCDGWNGRRAGKLFPGPAGG